MSTYFNDCSSLTGWTDQALGSSSYSTDGSVITFGSSTGEALSVDAVDSDAERQAIEVLIKVKIASITTTHYVAVARGSDSSSAATLAGYFVALRSTAIRTYYKNSGGSTTQISNGTISALSNDTYYWVRLRCNGTTIRARVWADGGSEGETWDCNQTDTNGPGDVDGYAGLYNATSTTTTWDAAGFGTNGDTAPSSAGGGGATAVTGKASDEAFGTITTLKGQVTRTVTGKDTDESLGTVTPALKNVTITVSGKDTDQDLGTVTTAVGKVTQAITGKGTDEAFGTVTTTALGGLQTVDVTGKASDEALGTVTVIAAGAAQNIAVTGKGTDEAFGTITIPTGAITIVVSGKDTDEAFGTITRAGRLTITVGGKASDEAFGTVTSVQSKQFVSVSGKASDQALGVVILVGGVPVSTTAATFSAIKLTGISLDGIELEEVGLI